MIPVEIRARWTSARYDISAKAPTGVQHCTFSRYLSRRLYIAVVLTVSMYVPSLTVVWVRAVFVFYLQVNKSVSCEQHTFLLVVIRAFRVFHRLGTPSDFISLISEQDVFVLTYCVFRFALVQKRFLSRIRERHWSVHLRSEDESCAAASQVL